MACTGCTQAVWGGPLTPLISDDFESYAGVHAAFQAVWTSTVNPLQTAQAQGGTYSMGNIPGALYARPISPPTSVIVFALPIWWGPSSGAFGSEGILNFHVGATHNGFNSHCSLRLDAAGIISMRYSSSSTLRESAASGLIVSQWNCITGVIDIADAGAWKIYVNGAIVLDGTGDLFISGAIGGVSVATAGTYYVDNFWLATVPTFADAVHCPQKIGNLAFGYKPTIKATQSALGCGDDDPHTLTDDYTFELFYKNIRLNADNIELNGAVTGGGGVTDLDDLGDVNASTPATDDVLTYDGSEWVPAPVPGSGMVLLEQHTASSSASLDFTTAITSAHSVYQIECVNVVPAADASLYMLVSSNGGSTWASANYQMATQHSNTNGTTGVLNSTGQAFFYVWGTVEATSSSGLVATITLYDPLNATVPKLFLTRGFSHNSDANFYAWTGGLRYNSTSAVNAVRFVCSTGNIASGTIRMYGLTQ